MQSGWFQPDRVEAIRGRMFIDHSTPTQSIRCLCLGLIEPLMSTMGSKRVDDMDTTQLGRVEVRLDEVKVVPVRDAYECRDGDV